MSSCKQELLLPPQCNLMEPECYKKQGKWLLYFKFTPGLSALQELLNADEHEWDPGRFSSAGGVVLLQGLNGFACISG